MECVLSETAVPVEGVCLWSVYCPRLQYQLKVCACGVYTAVPVEGVCLWSVYCPRLQYQLKVCACGV